MPDPLLRGSIAALQQGANANLFDANMITAAVAQNLGNSTAMSRPDVNTPTHYGDWKFPVIPFGSPTTIIPVAFPLTRAPTESSTLVKEQVELVVVFFAALVIWMLPTTCINKKLCSQCFRRFLSKWLCPYFFLGLVINVTIISIVIARAPHIEANSLFFTAVKIVEKVTDSAMKVLIQFAGLGAIFLLYTFRKKIASLLGFDQNIFKASLRDFLTGFSMKRFQTIEVTLWKAEGLRTGFSSRTLFTRVTLGFNEAQHTRPIDGCRSSFTIKERIKMNYDPEDDTQKLSIMVKMQEVIGNQVNQLLPVAGAMVGAVGGMTTPLGAGPGAALGIVTGTGAANSVGAEVARVDLSSAFINRIRETFKDDAIPNSDRQSVRNNTHIRYAKEDFQRVDLIPQGELWLRIVDAD